MGKTFRRNSDDFHHRKSTYEGRNCVRENSEFYIDYSLIEDTKKIVDSNNRKSKKYVNDKKRR